MSSQDITDKVTIGMTPDGGKVVEQLMETEYFDDQMSCAKLGMAIAIREGCNPGKCKGTSTIWNVGTFDKDGELRQMIPVLFPTENAPHRAVESLMDQGLRLLGERVNAGGFDLVATLAASTKA